jgi:hypothetical protein
MAGSPIMSFTSPGERPTMESTLGSADRAPLRGGTREAVLPEGLAQARSPAARLAQAGSPGGLVTGARSVHLTGRLLQPSPSRARDRRCSSHAVGVEAPGVSNHRGSARRRKPDRAPEPRKLGGSGPERGLAAQEGGSRGQPREALNGVREIPVVLVDRRRLQTSAQRS